MGRVPPSHSHRDCDEKLHLWHVMRSYRKLQIARGLPVGEVARKGNCSATWFALSRSGLEVILDS
jgi:hypothetical protein